MTIKELKEVARKLGGFIVNLGRFRYRLVIQNIDPAKSKFYDYYIFERN